MGYSTPNGFRLVYNRLDRKFERMFDGQVFQFAPNETLMLPELVAEFITLRSVIKFDPFTNESVHALVMDGDPDFERAYTEPLQQELLSRDTVDKYVLGNTGGLQTHPEVIPVPGGGYTGPDDPSRNTPLLTKRV